MTLELGPADTDQIQPNVLQWIGTRSASVSIWLLNTVSRLGGEANETHINHERGEITLRGESDHVGDGYNRGYIVGLLEAFTAFVWAGIGALAGAAALGFGSVVSLSVGLVAMLSAFSVIGSLSGYTVVDLTTEAPDDRLDDLTEQYLNGEIDEAELEREADKLVEHETATADD